MNKFLISIFIVLFCVSSSLAFSREDVKQEFPINHSSFLSKAYKEYIKELSGMYYPKEIGKEVIESINTETSMVGTFTHNDKKFAYVIWFSKNQEYLPTQFDLHLMMYEIVGNNYEKYSFGGMLFDSNLNIEQYLKNMIDEEGNI